MLRQGAAIVDSQVQTRLLREQLARASTGRHADQVLFWLIRACAVAILLLVIAIGVSMVVGAAPALQAFGFGFLFSQSWDPVNGQFGALPFIYGTLVTSLVAIVVGGPIALGAAIALSELVPL